MCEGGISVGEGGISVGEGRGEGVKKMVGEGRGEEIRKGVEDFFGRKWGEINRISGLERIGVGVCFW